LESTENFEKQAVEVAPLKMSPLKEKTELPQAQSREGEKKTKHTTWKVLYIGVTKPTVKKKKGDGLWH